MQEKSEKQKQYLKQKSNSSKRSHIFLCLFGQRFGNYCIGFYWNFKSKFWYEELIVSLSIEYTKSVYSNHNWSTIYFPIHRKQVRDIKIIFCIILKLSLPKRSKNSKNMLLIFKTLIFKLLWKMFTFYQEFFLGKKITSFYFVLGKKKYTKPAKKTKQYLKKKLWKAGKIMEK